MTLDLDIVIYLLGLAVAAGTILTRVITLEKKVENHSKLVEKMAALERDVKSSHLRIDELKGELNERTSVKVD